MRRMPAVLALVAVAAGCGADPDPEPDTLDVPAMVECRVPCETVTDWVSYADHVAYGEASSATSVEVGDLLWTRKGAPRPPADLYVGRQGIDEGGRYLVVMVQLSDSGAQDWSLVAPDAVLPVDDDGVPLAAGADTQARAALVGESPDEIAALLAGTPPDPVAARYFDRDPIARFTAVQLDHLPELHGFVKVVGDMGTPGYVRSADLPRTDGPSPQAIPVYGENGQVQVDTFTAGVGLLHHR